MQIDDNHFKSLKNEAGNYLKAQIERFYYAMGIRISRAFGYIGHFLLVVVFAAVAFLFLNIALSFAVGSWLKSTPAMGFLIVGGFYFLLLMIWLFVKPKNSGLLKSKVASFFLNLADDVRREMEADIPEKIKKKELPADEDKEQASFNK